MLLKSFETPEQIPNRLPNRLHDICARPWGRRSFRPQERLAAFHPRADRADRHPGFRPSANRFIAPEILAQTLRCQAPGKSPFVGIHFANSKSEHRAAHRIEEIASQQALKSAA